MLFKKTANMVAVVKVKTRADKLVITANKALVETLANILAEIQMQKLRDTVDEVKAQLLVNKVAYRIAVIRVKTLGLKLNGV